MTSVFADILYMVFQSLIIRWGSPKYPSTSEYSAVGSAGGLGPSGREFNSLYSDQKSGLILVDITKG